MRQGDDILEFIRRRFSKDGDWTCGNCLWFAAILARRFPRVDIWYLPIEGHFVVRDVDGVFYDWTGRIEALDEEPFEFVQLKYDDPLLYERLLRDCWL